jgi:hypothetical protein
VFIVQVSMRGIVREIGELASWREYNMQGRLKYRRREN